MKSVLKVALPLVFTIVTCGCCPKEDCADTGSLESSLAKSQSTSNIASVPSGEGMWPWTSIEKMDQDALRARGLEVFLSKLWTPGKGGLAGAAVGLGGCTGSFISDDGLLITNHHCAMGAIQRNSTEEHNYLMNGYVASKRDLELDGKGLKVYVFKSQRDVTKELEKHLESLSSPSDYDRIKAIENKEKELVKTCEEKPNTSCYVSRNNNGLSYTLFERTELNDVRIVAAPPNSVGNYGGKIDNWHWPRHTMDFTLIRAYVDKDGKPAYYDPANVPYKPEHFFTMSQKGVSSGDLVMIMGTPGRTQRYRCADSLKAALDWHYPLRVSLLSEWMDILESICKEDPSACLPTSITVRSLDNGLTNSRGMIEGLKRNGLLGKKYEEEKEWREWVDADPGRKERFGDILGAISAELDRDTIGRDRDFLLAYMTSSRWPQLLGSARVITKWATEQQKPDEARKPGFQERDRKSVLNKLIHSQRSIHIEANKRGMAMFLRRLAELGADEHVEAFDKALSNDYSEKSIARFVDKLYAGTRLGEKEIRKKLFETPLEELNNSKDTMVRLALDLAEELDALEVRRKSFEGAMSRLRPVYVQSLIEMKKKSFYPDANGSPRVTFGTVTGYIPKDGVTHTPFTSLDGLAAKHTGKGPFDAPKNMLDAIAADNFGPYEKKGIGSVPLCFLSNSDTTGGNSGSPAVSGKGELVGLNFDRVYENIAGDWGYNPPKSRNIMVDARSILWYLDVVLGASNLMDEIAPAK